MAEGTFALIQPIYELMASAVREQGGSVKDFAADGIMALFGVPDALEDGPLRACRAGLAIHARLAADIPAIEVKHGVRPQMRIGLNSGLAVVAEIRGEGGSATALGDTVNLASRSTDAGRTGNRLSERSDPAPRPRPGRDDLRRRTRDQRQGRAVESLQARSDPPGLYSVRYGWEARPCLYVGRERELDVLERARDEARQELRVIDIVAEPGMGKSRLLHEFRRLLGESKAFILTGTCSPDGQVPQRPAHAELMLPFDRLPGQASTYVP